MNGYGGDSWLVAVADVRVGGGWGSLGHAGHALRAIDGGRWLLYCFVGFIEGGDARDQLSGTAVSQ